LDPQGNLVVLHELTDEDEIKSLLGSNATLPPTGPKLKQKNPKGKKTGDSLQDFLGTPSTPTRKSSYSSKKSGKSG
jgi:hypothetical protein